MDIIGIPNKPWADGGVPLPLSEWIEYGTRRITNEYRYCDSQLQYVGIRVNDALSKLGRKVDTRITRIMADVIAACEWRVEDGQGS